MAKKKNRLHRAYWVAAGIFILMFPTSFILNAASIFYTAVSEDLHIAQTAFGMHIAITEATMAVVLPLINKIFCRYDTRITVTACMILEGAAFLCNAMARTVWVFYVDALILGCCEALLLFLLIPVLINNWFSTNVGVWIGICGAAQGIAGTVFNSLGALIISNAGWRVCYLVWAAICIGVGVPVSLFLIRFRPEDVGMRPAGAAPSRSEASEQMGMDAKAALRTTAFLCAALCPNLLSLAADINFYMNQFYIDIGMTAVMAGTAASCVMFGNMFGKLTIGVIADKNLKIAAYLPCTGMAAAALFIFVAPKYLWVSWAAAFLLGITYGTCNTLGPILVKNTFGSRDFSAIWAQVTRMQSVFLTVGAVIWGVSIERLGYFASMRAVFFLVLIGVYCGLHSLRSAEKMREKWTC